LPRLTRQSLQEARFSKGKRPAAERIGFRVTDDHVIEEFDFEKLTLKTRRV
jgi:hypothetical protein